MNNKLLEEAKTLVEKEQFDEAKKIYEELIKNVDDKSNLAVDVYYNYACLLDIDGPFEDAIKYAKMAYKLNKELAKEDESLLIKQAEISDLLGDFYVDYDIDKMPKYYAEAIKIWKKNIDKNKDYKLFIACDALDIANYADEYEDLQKADKYFNLAYRTWNKYLKEVPNEEYDIDRITKDIYKGMADWLFADDMDKAEKIYKKVIKICKKYMGTDEYDYYGYDYVDSLYKLSDLYYDDETYEKSLKYLVQLDNYLKNTDDEEYLEIAIEAVKRLEDYYDTICLYDKAKKYATKYFNYAKKQYSINNEKILDYADASNLMITYSDDVKYKALALGLARDFDPEGETDYYKERFRELALVSHDIEEDYDTWMDLYEKKYNKKH